jgi:hypothetical protein
MGTLRLLHVIIGDYYMQENMEGKSLLWILKLHYNVFHRADDIKQRVKRDDKDKCKVCENFQRRSRGLFLNTSEIRLKRSR